MPARTDYVSLDHHCYQGGYFRTLFAGAVSTVGLGIFTGCLLYSGEERWKVGVAAGATLTALWTTVEAAIGIRKARPQYTPIPIQTAVAVTSAAGLREIKEELDRILHRDHTGWLGDLTFENQEQYNLWALIDVQLNHLKDQLTKGTNRESIIQLFREIDKSLKNENGQFGKNLLQPVLPIKVTFEAEPRFDHEELRQVWRSVWYELIRNWQLQKEFCSQINEKLESHTKTLEVSLGIKEEDVQLPIKHLIIRLEKIVRLAEKKLKEGSVEETL